MLLPDMLTFETMKQVALLVVIYSVSKLHEETLRVTKNVFLIQHIREVAR